MSELQGQTSMLDMLEPAATGPAEGYDEQGHLMDYTPAAAPAPRTPEIIAAEINAIKRQAMAVAITAAMEIGEKLTEARNLVPRGRWTEWLQANVDYSVRKAQDLMRFYESYHDSLPDAIARLDYTKAFQLLALPEPEREAMAERAAAEEMSTRQLEAEIKRLREAHAEAQQTIFNLSQENEAARRDLEKERAAAFDAEQRAQNAAKDTEGWKAVSAKATQDAANSAAQFADAVQRANESQRQVDALRAELERLKAEPIPAVEVAPAPDPDAEADKRRMALALRVRMAAQDCAEALKQAVGAASSRAETITGTLEVLRTLDDRRAAALTDEVWALSALAQACVTALEAYAAKVAK